MSPAYLVLVSTSGCGCPLQIAGLSAPPPMPGQAFTLLAGKNFVGRSTDPAITIFLPWMCVSRRHAQIEFDGHSTWDVTDLNSTNGTELNNQMLLPNAPLPICAGDRIRLAGIEFLFSFQPPGPATWVTAASEQKQ